MKRQIALVALLSVALVALGGCGSGDDSKPSKETTQQADRITEIRKSTGSDWSKVSDADKAYLINEVGHGSESTAKMIFSGPGKPVMPPGVHKK